MEENRDMNAEYETVSEDGVSETEAAVWQETADTSVAASENAETEDNGGTPDAEEVSGVEIVGIRFRSSGKIYYFDPAGLTFARGDNAVVETARGMEYGRIITPNRIVPQTDIVPPLRRVVRAATAEDRKRAEDNAVKEVDAFNVCVQKIAQHKLEMKLVDVEYAFDNSRLLFYFTADGRVDFRDLVKDLASVFRTRIELRQIGIRDEAKLLGGLGICGRPFCCHSFLSDFVQVSIKMAKEQNLSLNSAKISGTCGRLMCCLRYESETYAEEIARTPRVDALVETADGAGIVTENSPLAGWIKVRLAASPEESPRVYHRDDVKILKPSGAKEAFSALVSEEQERAAARHAEKETAQRSASAGRGIPSKMTADRSPRAARTSGGEGRQTPRRQIQKRASFDAPMPEEEPSRVTRPAQTAEGGEKAAGERRRNERKKERPASAPAQRPQQPRENDNRRQGERRANAQNPASGENRPNNRRRRRPNNGGKENPNTPPRDAGKPRSPQSAPQAKNGPDSQK